MPENYQYRVRVIVGTEPVAELTTDWDDRRDVAIERAAQLRDAGEMIANVTVETRRRGDWAELDEVPGKRGEGA